MPNIFGQKTSWNLYHYTDLNAMISIVGTEHLTLRATNILYLNDPNELKEGINSIKDQEELHPASFRSYYITSFSSSRDNLSMWGMYAANGNGCALVLDYDELSKAYGIMLKCSYGKEEARNYYNQFNNLAKTGVFTSFSGINMPKKDEEYNRDALIANNTILTCLGAKNEAYRHEDETRGILMCDDVKLIRFRTRNGYVVPYIEVPIPRMALKEVILGPTDNSELKELSVLHFLQIKGFNLDDVKVTKSQVPYRG